MMFKSQFHPGIVDGSVTMTFRYWKRPQARPGSLQKINPIGHIEILAVVAISPSRVKAADARQSGFPDRKAMLEYLAPFESDDRILYRITFRFAGERRDQLPDQEPADDESELASIDRALDLRDKNSKAGAWTRDTLRLVGNKPGVSSKLLALELGRDQADLKQDMRKLKKLGLTISLETGYRLSPRGESYARARLNSR